MTIRKVSRKLRRFKFSRKRSKLIFAFCCGLTIFYITTFNQGELIEETERADFYQIVHSTNETPSDYFIPEDYKTLDDDRKSNQIFIKVPPAPKSVRENLDSRQARAVIQNLSNGSTVLSICCSDFHQSPYTHDAAGVTTGQLPKVIHKKVKYRRYDISKIGTIKPIDVIHNKESSSGPVSSINKDNHSQNYVAPQIPPLLHSKTKFSLNAIKNASAKQNTAVVIRREPVVSTSTISYDRRNTFGLLIDELTDQNRGPTAKYNKSQYNSNANKNYLYTANGKIRNSTLTKDLSRWKKYLSLSEDDPQITYPAVFDDVQSKSKEASKKKRMLVSSYADITRNTIRPVDNLSKLSFNQQQLERRTFENGNKTILKMDYSRPAYFPWRTTSDECSHYPIRFLEKGSWKIEALASFPGSGNSWLRYVIEVLSGVFTGSVYVDEELAKRGFWGERDSYVEGTTIMQKSHSYPLLPEDNTSPRGRKMVLGPPPRKVVLLVRNPFDAMISLRHYHAAGHTGVGHYSAFDGPDWHNWTQLRTEHWLNLNKAWITLPQTKVYVVHYERMQNNLAKEAENILRFLEIPIDYGRLNCLLKYPEGLFKRPHYRRNGMYKLTKKAEKMIISAASSLNELLSQNNLTHLPFHLYEYPLYTKIRY